MQNEYVVCPKLYKARSASLIRNIVTVEAATPVRHLEVFGSGEKPQRSPANFWLTAETFNKDRFELAPRFNLINFVVKLALPAEVSSACTAYVGLFRTTHLIIAGEVECTNCTQWQIETYCIKF